MQYSEQELKELTTSRKLDREVREGFGYIRAEIWHGRDWNNLNKLRKIRKELAELQALIDEGVEEIAAGKEPEYRPGRY